MVRLRSPAAMGDASLFGYFAKGEYRIWCNGVFEEIGSEFLDLLRQNDGFAGDHVAVYFNADIHVPIRRHLGQLPCGLRGLGCVHCGASARDHAGIAST